MTILSNEIIDKILIKSGDFVSSIKLNNKYVVSKLYNPKIHTLSWASENGHLDVVKWLHENYSENNDKKNIRKVIYLAFINGHFEVMEWIIKNLLKNEIPELIFVRANNCYCLITHYYLKKYF